MNSAEHIGWSKSHRSNASGNCVEVGPHPSRRAVGVRGSKQRGHGPVLEFTAPVWKAFTAAIREGRTSL